MKPTLLLLFLVPAALLSQSLDLSNPLRFLALGDSYTIGQSVAVNSRWPMQLSDSLASRGIATDTLTIIATTGWRSDDLLSAISGQELGSKNYNLVSLLIGVNNQYQGTPFSQYLSGFPALLDSAVRYAGGNKARVFVVSIPDYAYTPFGQQSPNPAQISAEIDQYNLYNKRVADSLGIAYFDITPISRQGLQNSSFVANDGLHPGEAQYAAWVKLMLSFIDAQVATGLNDRPDLNSQAITLCPSPASEELIIGCGPAEALCRIEIYAASGNLVLTSVFSGPQARIPLASLREGIYSAKISCGNTYTVKKFIKTGE